MRNTSPLRGKPISEDIYLTETLGLHPQENYYEIKQLFPGIARNSPPAGEISYKEVLKKEQKAFETKLF